MNCSDLNDALVDLVDGRLDGAAQRNVERHLEGCANCRATTQRVEQVAKELGVAITLQKVEEIQDIMAYGILATPGVVVDGFMGIIAPRGLPDAVAKRLEAELIAFCRKHLSPIKCPKSIDFEAELPRTPTGKLVKRHLRDRYWGNRKPAQA